MRLHTNIKVTANWEPGYAGRTMLISDAGKVYAFGQDLFGTTQYGIQEHKLVCSPQQVESLKHIFVVQAAIGKFFTAVLSREGRVYSLSWGNESKVGHNTEPNDLQPYPLLGELENILVVQIAAGYCYLLALACQSSGMSVFSVGCGLQGKLGHGSRTDEKSPRQIEQFTTLNFQPVMVSAGSWHAAVVGKDGRVCTWSWGRDGCLGYNNGDSQSVPKVVEALSRIKDIHVAAGNRSTYVVSPDIPKARAILRDRMTATGQSYYGHSQPSQSPTPASGPQGTRRETTTRRPRGRPKVQRVDPVPGTYYGEVLRSPVDHGSQGFRIPDDQDDLTAGWSGWSEALLEDQTHYIGGSSWDAGGGSGSSHVPLFQEGFHDLHSQLETPLEADVTGGGTWDIGGSGGSGGSPLVQRELSYGAVTPTTHGTGFLEYTSPNRNPWSTPSTGPEQEEGIDGGRRQQPQRHVKGKGRLCGTGSHML